MCCFYYWELLARLLVFFSILVFYDTAPVDIAVPHRKFMNVGACWVCIHTLPLKTEQLFSITAKLTIGKSYETMRAHIQIF